jgi:hypothetical protein
MAIDVASESALTPVREYLDAELTAGRLDYGDSPIPLK